ncbi:tyrosine-type recombinase/integrase [Haloimpatiens massiliensis]|uniref:tyrosine-type recombinase/integrase n=1 Tax=Haloimpatiens massiliensis TaxID=1658110 RepID=UPI000C84939C|nr:tyrosine-type recombinase/integrase [Haloimpatiens massiliensis]
MIKNFSSNFAGYIEGMVKEKHNSGFSLKYMDKHLIEFDSFCMEYFPNKVSLDKELVEAWVYYTKSKSVQEMQKRFRTMMHLGNYMLPLKSETYIAKNRIKKVKPKEPHIFTDVQLVEFFQLCDAFKAVKYPPYRHLVASVIFRMIYCCGLRNSEACNLKCCDVNLQEGIIKIYESKGHKNRMVYMSDDLINLCRKYNLVMDMLNPKRKYFFPSSRSDCYTNILICKLFDSILNKTSFYGKTSKKPTCHRLRHTFAVNSMRKCISEGEDFDIMIRYLSRYMGHSCPQNTMYYLHMVVTLVPEIRKMAKGYEDILNGVTYVEEY